MGEKDLEKGNQIIDRLVVPLLRDDWRGSLWKGLPRIEQDAVT